MTYIATTDVRDDDKGQVSSLVCTSIAAHIFRSIFISIYLT